MQSRTSDLELPDEQPYLPRLSGAGSLRRELEAVIDRAPPGTVLEGYRRLILEENAAGKRSGSMRVWTWKRLKVRYLLDTRVQEFRVFRSAMDSTRDPTERGLLAYLMMARTDRLFREVVAEQISPHLLNPSTAIDGNAVREAVARLATRSSRDWTSSVIDGTTAHVMSACKDYGLLEGSTLKRTVAIRPGPVTAAFAVRLARLEGLGDRRTLDSRWFQLLGMDFPDVLDVMQRAARTGALTFRFQADVAEIRLPEVVEAHT